ncbi:MAG: phenylalanine--tRNA ligase subunit beta [Dehalococcoidia bacterium]|nr:phenylalanine--tRNA ligase subunit beta [Dehalococcoidia bacterium]
MKVPLKWLGEYVDINLPAQELARRLTMAGTEVDAILTTGREWEKISVAQVVGVSPHPNADRLRLATVELGGEQMTVVCGAPNVAPGQKVAFARLGAELIDGHSGQPTILKAAKIRGVESAGMVCSEKELGLSDSHEGILVLPEDAPVGMPLGQYLGDTILDLDVTPNRPDCLSVLGIAREVAALSGGSVREPPGDYQELGQPIKERVRVEIADRDLCPRYCAALIEGVQIGPSPPWMQERLVAAGVRPISNVVDITNYVMLEVGQPLHSFDFSLISDRKIIVRRARPGEVMVTLDGTDRPLNHDMLVIADAKEAVAVAGLMGGAASEVSENATAILLESANFNPASIRRTSTALKLRTDASARFEKGLNPELAMVAIRRAVRLMLELAGGRAAEGIIDVYPGKRRETRITVTQERLRRVLGLQLPTPQVRQTLVSLGFGCRWVPPDRYVVRVPYWRTDVHIPDDVAEELARIIGYGELPTTTLSGAIPPAQPQPSRELRERVRDILAAAGMQEVITYSLTNLESLAKVLPPEELSQRPPLRVTNPMSYQQEYLRTTLRASLLETLASNLRHAQRRIALFEVGRVYLPRPEELPHEVESLAGVGTGDQPDRWRQPRGEPVDLYDAKAYLELLFNRLGLAVSYHDSEDFALVPGRTAEVRLDGQRVGLVGQVHPRVAASFDIEQDVYLFEVNLETLVPQVGKPRLYQSLSRFPAVEEDIAIVVDEGVTAAQVQAIVEAFSLVQRAALFDVYTGPPVPAGKKSLAYAISYQSLDHTLTDAEVDRERRRILERLSREVGAVLRG